MRFKKLIGFLMLVAISSTTEAQQKQPFTIEIKSSGTTFVQGSLIPIQIYFTNVSSEELYLPASASRVNAEEEVDVQVSNAAGKLLQQKETTSHIEHRHNFRSPRAIILKPGEQGTDTLMLNDIYQLTEPGTYAIRISRRIPADDQPQGNVTSNVINIEISRLPNER